MGKLNKIFQSVSVAFDSAFRSLLDQAANKPAVSEVAPLKSHHINPGTLSPGLIRFLNWNAYKGVDDKWVADFSHLVHDKDLIVIQEIAFTRQLQAALSERSLSWCLTKSFDHRHGVTGVMTASKSPACRDFGLHSKEPLLRIPKSSLVTWYPLDGMKEQLLVANIHSVNFSVGVKAFQKQLERLEQVVVSHDGPVILSGDFNTWRYKRYEILTRMVIRLQLIPVHFSEDNRRTVLGMPIDHIFYRGMEAIGHKVPLTTSSDHHPMEVDFKVG